MAAAALRVRVPAAGLASSFAQCVLLAIGRVHRRRCRRHAVGRVRSEQELHLTPLDELALGRLHEVLEALERVRERTTRSCVRHAAYGFQRVQQHHEADRAWHVADAVDAIVTHDARAIVRHSFAGLLLDVHQLEVTLARCRGKELVGPSQDLVRRIQCVYRAPKAVQDASWLVTKMLIQQRQSLGLVRHRSFVRDPPVEAANPTVDVERRLVEADIRHAMPKVREHAIWRNEAGSAPGWLAVVAAAVFLVVTLTERARRTSCHSLVVRGHIVVVVIVLVIIIVVILVIDLDLRGRYCGFNNLNDVVVRHRLLGWRRAAVLSIARRHCVVVREAQMSHPNTLALTYARHCVRAQSSWNGPPRETAALCLCAYGWVLRNTANMAIVPLLRSNVRLRYPNRSLQPTLSSASNLHSCLNIYLSQVLSMAAIS